MPAKRGTIILSKLQASFVTLTSYMTSHLGPQDHLQRYCIIYILFTEILNYANQISIASQLLFQLSRCKEYT